MDIAVAQIFELSYYTTNMAERLTQQERPSTPERSREEVYVETLKLKRDVMSSHYTMNSLRREIDNRIEEMTDEQLNTDPEVAKYKQVSDEYRRRKQSFLESLEGLSAEDKNKLSSLTNLTKLEVELSSFNVLVAEPERTETPASQTSDRPEREITLEEAGRMLQISRDRNHQLETAYWGSKIAELQEKQKAEEEARRKENINRRIKEIENILVEKYRILYQEVSVIDRRSLEEEIKKLEDEKSRLEKELESPEGKVGKSWGDRIRGVFGRRKAEISSVSTSAEPEQQTTTAVEQPQAEQEGSKRGTVLGWLAERGKGILSAGVWEVRQAWRFQRGTKFAANDLEALSKLVHVENADEAQGKANEILELMRENNITTVTASEFLNIANQVTYEKAAENNDRIDYMIKNAMDALKDRVAKYRGQATAETVLTPENLKNAEADLRTQLNKFRDGATMKDVESFAKVMRDNMDKKWWLRYVYAPLEASLLGYLGYTSYLLWSRWFGGGDLIPGGEDIAVSPEESGQRYLDHNMWEESREHLKELGVENPTNQEIQAVDSAAAQENNIRVVNPENSQTIWPDTAGGQTKDISMVKGLIKWGAAHKAALAIKAARLGIKVATGF